MANSDMNSFPRGGMPVLKDDGDRVCLGTLYDRPLKSNGFLLDLVGNSRLFGTLNINGPISGATNIDATGTVTLSGSTPLSLSGANAVLSMTGANAVLSMTGINASIGTNLSPVCSGFFRDLTVRERIKIGESESALICDLARYTLLTDTTTFLKLDQTTPQTTTGVFDLITKKHSIQLTGDMRGQYVFKSTKILLDLGGNNLKYPNGITVTNWRVFCDSAPTTQLAATFSYCDNVTSASFPGANVVVLDTIATTAGYQARTDMSGSTKGNGIVPAGEILYLALTADPTDYNKAWTIEINFTTT